MNNIQEKYSKDLEELSVLKEKARNYKPKSSTPVGFFRTVLTLSLFIILFSIAFTIAYQKQQSKNVNEVLKFVPDAEIILP